MTLEEAIYEAICSTGESVPARTLHTDEYDFDSEIIAINVPADMFTFQQTRARYQTIRSKDRHT